MMIVDLENFILANIYTLLILNIGLLISIFFLICKTRVIEKRDQKVKSELTSFILLYMEKQDSLSILKAKLDNKNKKMIAIDIINEMSESDSIDRSQLFIALELDTFLVSLTKQKPCLTYLRKLLFMKVPSSYDVFLQNTFSTDMEIQYISFFGLLLLKVDKERKYYIVQQLIKSDIYSDRIIEILEESDLKMEDWLKLLEEEQSEIGKVILLKIIAEQKEITYPENSDKLLKYFDETKEIRIAAIAAVCNSKNEKYVEMLYHIYKTEEMWEIRTAIAKGMVHFDAKLTKDKYLQMIKDKEWWVRFNAARAISLMGEEGLYTLIDLSIDKSNENSAALAYYFLNSNKEIYETIKNLEE